MFYNNQENELKEKYKNLLIALGSLSKLYSSSIKPYLHYRGHEGVFNYSFKAVDHSRSDISFDSSKNSIALGLKTFLHNNGSTFQKIAEFNTVDSQIRQFGSNHKKLIKYISEQRNKRLEQSLAITGCEHMLYHLLTRSDNEMHVSEVEMTPITLKKIKGVIKKNNIIHFRDNFYEYKFSLSKNTLFKKFDLSNQIVDSFEVRIIDNPYDVLNDLIQQDISTDESLNGEFIILPLYNARNEEVSKGTGLNKWNAAGRKRHKDEVSISIPRWIHTTFPDFFSYNPNNNQPFNLKLPNGLILPAKVCEQGGKALQSNPNRALGNWLLRDVLKVPAGKLVTLKMLREANIDSVMLTKVDKDSHQYEIDFLKCGSYQEFYDNNQ
ncbi:phospholipase D-like domain-containing protein [Kangiella koreensis]|uniref:Restriction endonuclease n=1 Tax=Kangiella koreensis (strain DSM 16069 / JCM 12317 / KCTC 12182 / SW-125) TaxID=523791 RepID=C7RCX4_KANKD|nr:restriction endonuclease [Kangiella koreensis]ACV27116.1 restriction endonuclease [Kangiella koreensis DSM 16069]